MSWLGPSAVGIGCASGMKVLCGDRLSWAWVQAPPPFLLEFQNSVLRHSIFNDCLMRNDCMPGTLAVEYVECAR